MQIGAMNNPGKNLASEIRRIGKSKFDFIDLTFEAPETSPEKINIKKTRKLLKKYNLGLVGHTAWYLPIAYPFDDIRRATILEFEKSTKILSLLGGECINIHLAGPIFRLLEKNFIKYDLKNEILTLKAMIKVADKYNVKLMAENVPDLKFDETYKIFKEIPKLYLHLDIGHANITNDINLYFKKLSNRLVHMHIHDNHGKEDEHLSLGNGNINWKNIIRLIKAYNYNDTITLEIFTNNKDLLKSKKKFEKLWKNA